jgi:hypothetical protein
VLFNSGKYAILSPFSSQGISYAFKIVQSISNTFFIVQGISYAFDIVQGI